MAKNIHRKNTNQSSIKKLITLTLVFIFATSLFSQDYATFYVYRKKKMTMTGIGFKLYFNTLEVAQIPNGGRLEYRYYKQGRVNIMCGVFSE